MKKPFCALILLVALGLPGSARALETNELIALTAMPLVVAAAAELTDVPTAELMNVVATLNNANVPPTQFVEIVRYAPIAIVTPTEPRFTTYVTTEYGRGVSGDDLAYSIVEQYPAYGVEDRIEIVDPPVVTYVERETILPEVVVTRFEPQPFDPLALVAMPLAVAAVSELTDVPRNDLISFISALNRAHLPPTQFVEVVRYSPVMLVDVEERPRFLSFVTTQIDRGVIGRPLAFALADRIDVDDIDVLDPPTTVLVERDELLPSVVTTRVASAGGHPHGGPPGQLKKELGLQTGAEVVHGTSRGRGRSGRSSSVARVDRDDDDRPRPKRKVRKVRSDDAAPSARRVVRSSGGDDRPRGNSGKARMGGNSGSKGHGGGGGGGGGSKGNSGNSGKGNSGKGKGKG